MRPRVLHLIVCGILLALTTAACGPPAPTPVPPTPTPPPPTAAPISSAPTPAPNQVDVGGYKLVYRCGGEGSPTVILEASIDQAGRGEDAWTAWRSVPAKIAATTRVCAYSRANVANSDRTPKPRAAQDLARDLHALLVNAEIDGPYILVAPDISTWHVLLFAEQYPTEVAGIVLVDGWTADVWPRWLAALPPKSEGEPDALTAYRNRDTVLGLSLCEP